MAISTFPAAHRRRQRPLTAVATLIALACAGTGWADSSTAATADAAQQAAERAVEGAWSGVIFLARGVMEADAFVELNRDHEGTLGGTISLPAYGLKYLPLDDLEVEGTRLSFSFSRFSPRAKVDVVSPIRGSLSADGTVIEGEYVEGGVNAYPITLTKIGPPGTEPPAREPGALHALADDSRELKQTFNDDAGKVRALLLVSPTCPICLNKARMLQRYLLDRNPDPALAMYLVWGPMQGNETEDSAEQATASLVDSRVTHFWTPEHHIANAYMAPLGLADDVEPAWDTYMVFAPGVRWGETVPMPTFFMWEEKPLPEEGKFNALSFVAEIEKLLDETAGGSAPGR